MQKEYIGTEGTRHELIKYTLSSNTEVILTYEELEELLLNSEVYLDMKDEVSYLQGDISFLEEGIEDKNTTIGELEEQIKDKDEEINKYIEALDDLEIENQSLKNSVDVLETRLEIYKETTNLYKDFQNKLSKIK